MKASNYLILSTSPLSQPAKKPRKTAILARRQRLLYGRKRHNHTGKERDLETGLYYYGARYLDSKTSRWLSGDPAVGDYVPEAPIDDEARKRNGNLPGMGGVFNYVNLHVYHYAGNNPVKYVDPTGKKTVVIYIRNENDWWDKIFGGAHVALYISDPGPSKTGDSSKPAIYDPSGSYSVDKSLKTRPSSGVFYGYDDSNLDNYLAYHLELGAEITLYIMDTTKEQEANMLDHALEMGEGPADIFCAMYVSDVLEEIGGEQRFTPGGVRDQMEAWVVNNKAVKMIINKDNLEQ